MKGNKVSLNGRRPEQPAGQFRRVQPAIMSPHEASQPGAPCNSVSHQPAITFKGAALEASAVRNPAWPRPGRRLRPFLFKRQLTH